MSTTTLKVDGAEITVETAALFRAWFDKHIASPSTPCIARPPLKDGEIYLGAITQPDGRSHHTIMLPGDVEKNWNDSMEWAKSIGGDLPDRIEQAMLLVFMPDEFQKRAYWSNQTHAANSDYAWCQIFDYGYQDDYYEDDVLRARAVRRVPI